MSTVKHGPRHLGRWTSVVCALTINLCAATPPDDGLVVGGGAGAGQYHYTNGGGCGGPVYRDEVTDMRAHARAQVHSRESRLAASLEGTYSRGEVTDSELIEEDPLATHPADEQSGSVGQTRHSYTVALRGGAHGAYVGVEMGPIWVAIVQGAAGHQGIPLLSMNLWAGVPEIVYVWVDALSGPLMPGWSALSAGVGHKGEDVRLSLGLAAGEYTQLTGRVDIKLSTEQPVWLGIVANASNKASNGVMMMIEVPLKID